MKKTILNYLMHRYKTTKQNSNNNSIKHCVDITHHMLKKSKYCFLITHGDHGWSNARLVQPVIKHDPKNTNTFTIWIGTKIDLRKVDNIWDNPKVTLAFEDSREDANLVIYGKATIETDPAIKKECWRTPWKMFFPFGPESEEYVAIKVQPSRLEILNFSKNITPEPIGLNHIKLILNEGKWQLS